MKRAFVPFLAVAVMLLAATYAGMAFFAMDDGQGHGGMDHGTPSGIECIDHCVSAVPLSIPLTTTPLAAPLTIFAALALLSTAFVDARAIVSVDRGREGIGKALLRQRLAGVIMRN